MVQVSKFKGFRYSLNNIENLVARPFDEIDETMRENYYKKSEYNIVNLTLPKGENKYINARNLIEKWIKDGILIQDDDEFYYPYFQEFSINGEKLNRPGFLARIKVEDYENNVIFPHERIYPKPMEDRLNLLKETNFILEPIMLLYNDPENLVMENLKFMEKDLEFLDDYNVYNRVFKSKSEIQELLRNEKLVIADGHHRYHASLIYKKELGYSYIMGYLININDKNFRIFPIHRIVKEINTDELFRKIKEIYEINEKEWDIKIITKDWTLKIKSSDEINVLTVNEIIENVLSIKEKWGRVKYEKVEENAINFAMKNKSSVAFILKGLDPKTVWNMAVNGKLLPEKSTYFFPKPISGVRIMKL